jgi:HK97 gp10 family phage protein
MNNLADFFNDLKSAINDTAKDSLEGTAKRICRDMKETVAVDTGKLKRSIKQKTERTNESTVTAYIYANAKNKQNGAQYAEFVEYGTGKYNVKGTGRTTPWRYKDSKGNWHTTEGQMPQPFIEPAVEMNIPDEMEVQIKKNISKYFKQAGH